jgi:pimeloyl-ACP methyl ester carboxylesterase
MISILEKTFHQVYQMVPDEIRLNIGEFFWNLNHTLLYIGTGAKEGVLLVQDLEISYIELGDPQKPTIVIVHGFSDSKESFLPVSSFLLRNFHILIPDLPGFGKSSKPDIDYSIDLYCQWLHEFLSKKNISHFHAIGNSMGGAILLEYIHQHSGEVLSLVLSCSAGLVPETEGNHFYSDYKNGKNLFYMKEEYQFEEFISKIFHRKSVIPFPVKDYIFHKYKTNGNWYEKLMEDILGKFMGPEEDDLRKQQKLKIENIQCPVLLLWGKHDGVIPEEIAYQFQDSIPHADLHILHDVGHLPHLENPADVYRILSIFYKEFL